MKDSTTPPTWTPFGPLSDKEIREAFLHVIGGRSGLRSEDAESWERCFRSMGQVSERLVRGELRFEKFSVHSTPKRSFVELGPIDSGIARSLAVRTRRVFDGRLQPRSRSAQLFGSLGPQKAFAAFLRNLERAHEAREVVEVCGFDVKDSHPSLGAARAIEVFEELTQAAGLARAHRALYGHVASGAPKLSGLFQGLAPSSVLQDIALLLLDDTIAPATESLLRYSDDSCAILREGVTVAEVWALVDQAEGVYAALGEHVRLHHRVHASVHRDLGFLTPFEWLGIRFDGTERYVAAKKLRELVEEVRRGEKKPNEIRRCYQAILTKKGRKELEEAIATLKTSGIPEVTQPTSPSLGMKVGQALSTASERDREAAPPASTVRVGGKRRASRLPRRHRASAIRGLRASLDEQGLLDANNTIFVHRDEEFKKFSTNLSREDGESSQYELVQAALARSGQLAGVPPAKRSQRTAHLLTLICVDFLATNSFGLPDNPAALGRFLAKLSELLGIQLVGWKNGEPL